MRLKLVQHIHPALIHEWKRDDRVASVSARKEKRVCFDKPRFFKDVKVHNGDSAGVQEPTLSQQNARRRPVLDNQPHPGRWASGHDGKH